MGIVISTHLPPPVIIESTDVLRWVTPHVVLELGHVLFGGGFLGERPGQHELRFKDRSRRLHGAVEGCHHPGNGRMLDLALDVGTLRPVLRSYQVRLSSSVAAPSCTMRLPDKSSGSASPRFSHQRRTSAASSVPIMIRASEPPMKLRLLMESANLKICLFIELSYPRVFAMLTVVPLSTIFIDKTMRERCQQKLLIIQ